MLIFIKLPRHNFKLYIFTGCGCFLPLGMESGYLPDSALSASSSWDANHTPELSRFNKIPPKGKAGAWCARSSNGNQWLQLYFGRETTVTKVAIQGRHNYNQWVMSFSLSYSVDGIHWTWHRLSDGQIKVVLIPSTFWYYSCYLLFFLLFLLLLLLSVVLLLFLLLFCCCLCYWWWRFSAKVNEKEMAF